MTAGLTGFLVRERCKISIARLSLPPFFSNTKFLLNPLHCTELSAAQREALKSSKRISNPGCYPTGFIGLTRPLVDAGIIPEGTPLTVNAVSGYSGGGKQLMTIFEGDDHEPWSSYGLNLVR